MKTITIQQLFDVGVKGVIEQGDLLIGYYRGSEDPSKKCIIGHNIPDDKYDVEYDLGGEYYTAEKVLLACNIKVKGNKSLVSRLQIVHDTCDNMSEFINKTKEFAHKYNLDTSVFRELGV